MPRPDDYDDYDDQPSRSRVPFPPGVKAAGIIWIGFGVLGLVTAGLSFVITLGAAGARPGQAPSGNPCGTGCSILFSLAFLIVGVQTVKGTAKGTLANGIGSIVFGLLYAGITILLLVSFGNLPGAPRALVFVMAGLCGLLAVALLTAGMLAIAGRDAYTEWLVAQGRGGRSRRRTAEERDYDDRPRRPRRERVEDEDDDPPRRRRDRDDEDDDR